MSTRTCGGGIGRKKNWGTCNPDTLYFIEQRCEDLRLYFSKAKGVPEKKRLGNNGVRYMRVSPAGDFALCGCRCILKPAHELC